MDELHKLSNDNKQDDKEKLQHPLSQRFPIKNQLYQTKMSISSFSPTKSCENLFTSEFVLTLDEKMNEKLNISASVTNEREKAVENDKMANFIMRMEKDLERRRTKGERLRILIEKSKIKHPEEEIVNGFNRLIDDANRRIEVRQKLEELNQELNSKKKDKNNKSYNKQKWEEIYQSRFEKYMNTVKEKINNKKKEKEEIKNKQTNEYIETMKNKTIKVPKEQINKICQRLYNGRRFPPKLIKKEGEEEKDNNNIKKENTNNKTKIKTSEKKEEKSPQKSPKKQIPKKFKNIQSKYNTINTPNKNFFKNRVSESKSPFTNHNVNYNPSNYTISNTQAQKDKIRLSKSPICRYAETQSFSDIEKIEESIISTFKNKAPELNHQNDFNIIKQHRPNCLKFSC